MERVGEYNFSLHDSHEAKRVREAERKVEAIGKIHHKKTCPQ